MSNTITQTELNRITDEKRTVKTYTNGEVTIYWQPDLCIHSANCIVGLPAVFKPRHRPWIQPEGASTQEIIQTINTCPSRALLYQRVNEPVASEIPDIGKREKPAFAKILANGPLLLSGNFILRDAQNNPIEIGEHDVAAICRCGSSAKKPFCDGSHVRTGYRDD
jgi:uncharacterized Fe-S cluster protein YjdI